MIDFGRNSPSAANLAAGPLGMLSAHGWRLGLDSQRIATILDPLRPIFIDFILDPLSPEPPVLLHCKGKQTWMNCTMPHAIPPMPPVSPEPAASILHQASAAVPITFSGTCVLTKRYQEGAVRLCCLRSLSRTCLFWNSVWNSLRSVRNICTEHRVKADFTAEGRLWGRLWGQLWVDFGPTFG